MKNGDGGSGFIGRLTILAAALALSVPGCATLPTPGTVANQTVLDEKLGIAVEGAYTAAARAAALAIRAGLIADVERVEKIRVRARSAVLATRAAYDAANATDYSTAAAQALALIAELTTLAGGRP